MNPSSLFRSRSWMCALSTAICVLFLSSGPAAAQIGIGPGSRGARPPKKPVRRQERAEPWREAGSRRGRIIKFEPAKSDDAEGILGTLKIKPIGKKTRMMTLQIRMSDQLRVELAGHRFDLDELADLPWKGLYCTAAWGYAEDDGDGGSAQDEEDTKRKPKQPKELRSLLFETIEVTGKIKQIEGDLITLRVKPKNDVNWPDREAREKFGPRNARGGKPKRVPRRKLTLKMMDDVTSFLSDNREPLDLGDFEVDQEIEATVTTGQAVKLGMIVKLAAPGVEVEPQGEVTRETEDRRGRKRPPPRGRPKPRGGGG